MTQTSPAAAPAAATGNPAVAAARARYDRDGYLSPIRVMAADAATALYDALEAQRHAQPDRAQKAIGPNCHLLFPTLWDLAHDPRVLDAVEPLIGPDILIWSGQIFGKPAMSGGYVSWHQDSTYWGLEPPDIVTAWVALTPSTVASGCMRVVPGSHGWGQLEHKDSFADHNLLSRGQEVQVDVDEATAVDIVLEPGEMSLHHVRIVHGSAPNRAAHPRFGFAIRYIPTYCRQARARTFAALARGTDAYGHFDQPPRPDAPLSEAAWSAHAESLARINAVMMAGATQDSRIAGYRAGS
ncbi:MAG: phytanoyl-CoA dioxygenase family protein [Alphaproteobacteria bacterium]